ncbi:hypothetical protein [Streptomyces minutiscleroticus]|uniref:hypothetical protein n=1 Tax=Streptomyces minutiscleroticus TaxID=68238 RepID=UPI0033340DF2
MSSTASTTQTAASVHTRPHEIREIAEEFSLPADDSDSTALARFALEAPRIARDQPDSTAALNAAFDLLEHGWQNTALA